MLYQGVDNDDIPTTQRHYDYQLWEEDVTPELKPVQPWREQPESLSTELSPEDFPLKLPPGTTSPPASQTPGNDQRRAEASPKKSALQSVSKRPANPKSSQPATGVEKSQELREYSYAHPLEVRTHMSVPINAPPVDALLNLGHDSVPAVSLSVLTPTEVRRLQRSYHDMRNLLLSRTERCPYAGCGAVFPANQPSAMQQHLHDKHTDAGREGRWNFCPWCGIELDEDISDRMMHLNKCKRKPAPDAKRPIDGGNQTYSLPSTSEVTSANKTTDTEPAPKRRKTERSAAAPDTTENKSAA